MFASWREPSVCRLKVCRLSVTFVRPAQRVELFVNIFQPLIAQGFRQLLLLGDRES